MDKLHILYNVDANVKKSGDILNAVEKYLHDHDVEHTTLVSNSKKESSDYISQLEEQGGGKVVVIGGDGTIHNIVNSIKDFSKICLGFIKGGSGNDLATTLNINSDPEAAIKDIVENEESTMDLIDVGGVKCANVAATGLDVEVLKQRDRMKHFKGNLKYRIATVITLIKFGSYHLLTKVDDGETKERQAMVIAVGNGKYFGGGMSAVPHADPFDGKLSVTVVDKLKKYQLPTNLPKFIKGTHDKTKCIHNFFADTISIEAPAQDNFTVDIDGELYTDLKFDCKVLKGVLRVVLPKPQLS